MKIASPGVSVTSLSSNASTTPASRGYAAASSPARAAVPDRFAAATTSATSAPGSGTASSHRTAPARSPPASAETTGASAGTSSAASDAAESAGSRNPHSARNLLTATSSSGLWYGS